MPSTGVMCGRRQDGGPACKGQRSDIFEVGEGEWGEERKAALRPGLVEAQTSVGGSYGMSLFALCCDKL